MKTQYSLMNETTSNNFYQQFIMTNTIQKMNENDITEASIKLNHKNTECYC